MQSNTSRFPMQQVEAQEQRERVAAVYQSFEQAVRYHAPVITLGTRDVAAILYDGRIPKVTLHRDEEGSLELSAPVGMDRDAIVAMLADALAYYVENVDTWKRDALTANDLRKEIAYAAGDSVELPIVRDAKPVVRPALPLGLLATLTAVIFVVLVIAIVTQEYTRTVEIVR